MKPIDETTWAVVNPKLGAMMYGIGNSRKSAWANAMLVVAGLDPDDDVYEGVQKSFQAEGWKTVKVAVIPR